MLSAAAMRPWRWMTLAAALLLVHAPLRAADGILPAEFRHDRIVLVAEAPDGDALAFDIDTGGWNAIAESAASRHAYLPGVCSGTWHADP